MLEGNIHYMYQQINNLSCKINPTRLILLCQKFLSLLCYVVDLLYTVMMSLWVPIHYIQ